MKRVERAKAILAAAELLAQGHSAMNAARETGLSYGTLRVIAHEGNFPLTPATALRSGSEASFPTIRKRREIAPPNARALEMIEARKRGDSLDEIGKRHGVTRERARQIIKKHGGPTGFLARVYSGTKTKERKAAHVAAVLARYKRTWAEHRQLVATGATQAWRKQKNSCRLRGIAWELPFEDWWRLWQESGHWEQRGRSRDAYVLTRADYALPFSATNALITTFSDCCRRLQIATGSLQKRDKGGVYHLYPNLARGWVAQARRKRLGYFASEAEARAAREAALRA